MQLSDFLTLLTRAFYLLAAVISIFNFARHRDRMRLDVALLFSTVGIVILFQILQPGLSQPPIWIRPLTTMMIMAMGYLILRIVQHFRRVPRWIEVFAIVGMVLSWIPVAIFYRPEPPMPQG